MHPTGSMEGLGLTRNRAALAAIIIAAAIAGPLGFATPAFAHNELIASTPAADETLTELPPRFSITTNEAMLDLPGSQGFALQIQDAAGAYYGDGCVQVVDATMSADAALGEPGEYTMLWQAVSEDGHSIDGTIPFTWAPESDVEPSASSATPPVCGEAVAPTPGASASPPPATGEPTAEPEAASGIDLPTVLWIGGAVLAIGIAVGVAIANASRRKPS
jgi:methionine-rich copper-binding protein CopC